MRKDEEASIFSRYFGAEPFADRFATDSARAVDVIIPIVHTNELWRSNLTSIYREIPVNRLLIGDGGCIDDSLEIARRFPARRGAGSSQVHIARLQHPPPDRGRRDGMVRLPALRRVSAAGLVRDHVRQAKRVRLVRMQPAHHGDGGLSARQHEGGAGLFRQPDGTKGGVRQRHAADR